MSTVLDIESKFDSSHNLTINTNYEHIRKLILAGSAIVTIRSNKTGQHYTYQIRHSKNVISDNRIYFVSVLHGKENTSDYAYLGIINPKTKFFKTTSKSRYSDSSTCVKAFKYFYDRLMSDSVMELEVFHECTCARCGRLLTTPESIKLGIGPECKKLMSV